MYTRIRESLVAALVMAGAVSHATLQHESPFSPQTGDLLFQIAGNTSFAEAITLATASADSLKFDHVAMVITDDDGAVMVIEANPERGVVETSLQEFLDSSPMVDGRPGVVVKRLNAEFSPETVARNAESHIGEEYDWYYLPGNGKMYCSELIFESFTDSQGEHIFGSQPMNFRAPDGSMPQFWVKLYGQLGIPVPEGVEGTNPQDLSKDSRLEEIFRYFY